MINFSKQQNLTIILFTFVILFFLSLSFNRASLWSDPFLIWTDAIEKSPSKARAYNNVGNFLIKKDEFSKAMPYLEKSLSLLPNYQPAHINMAAVYMHFEDWKSAELSLLNALKFGQPFPGTYNRLAVVYKNMNNYPQVIEVLTIALKKYKNNSLMITNLAAAYTDYGYEFGGAGNFNDALSNFNKALSVLPTHRSAVYGKALSVQELGHKKEALSLWKEYLYIVPSDDDYAEDVRNKITILESELN